MTAELIIRPRAARHPRAASPAGPAGRAPERAQLVWRRALELTGPHAHDDWFRLALALLRAAHHGPATMTHALNLGRARLRAHPDDAFARGGVALLEEAAAFLGVKPRADDIAGASR